MTSKHQLCRSIVRFARETKAASAVEFAIISLPVILLILMGLQMGIFYMAQSSLDAGVIRTADTLVNSFYSGSTPSIPTATALKTLVVTNSGGLIHNDSTLNVELRQFTLLSATVMSITSTVDSSVAGNILALRAQASIPVFVPGLSSIAVVRSTALIRRQNY